MSDPAAYNPQPPRPAWGVRAPLRKRLSTQEPILIATPPAQVTISLVQGPRACARPTVHIGQRVLCGEPIAEAAGSDDPRVHASIAGHIAAIGDKAVAGIGGLAPCVVIDGDGSDDRWRGYAPRPGASGLPAAELRELIADAGIVGLGGAMFPTARKLSAAGVVPLLLLNGAECEPYISCDDMLIRERADQLVLGGRILLAALGAEQCVIAVKTDMPEARIALYNALATAADPRIVMSVVTAKYPAGGERQLIELVLGREVPAGGLPADVGVVCQNVGTVAAVADFFANGRPMISRIVTVNGGGIARPRNIEARIGTSVRELVALAGGYQNEPRRLVMGGPMMGIALPDDALPITAGTNCLIAATDAELGQDAVELPCIRCGDCVEACPAHLLPQELLVAQRRANVGLLATLGVTECIECGACDYVCPSHIPLTQHFIAGKAVVADARWAQQQANVARDRFEARTRRLERDAQSQQVQPSAQAPAAPASGADPTGRHDLDALLARARQRPAGKPD